MFRAYSPPLGRWLSRDPIGETAGANLYVYVQNNPIGSVDPHGLDAGYPWMSEPYEPASDEMAQKVHRDWKYMTSPAEGAQYWNNYLIGMTLGVAEIAGGGIGGMLGAKGAGGSAMSGSSCGLRSQSKLPNLTISDKQLGMKYGSHMDEYPGWSSADYRRRVNEIYNDPNTMWTRIPEDAPVHAGEWHATNGRDLLRLDASGNFRSLYPGVKN